MAPLVFWVPGEGWGVYKFLEGLYDASAEGSIFGGG
jgi:hypothetical protein